MNMDMTWLFVFGAAFLLLIGIGIGGGLYTQHRKFWNDVHAREVRERRLYQRRTFL